MPNLVVNGALCKCSFGAAPCTLAVSPAGKVNASNMAVASIMDFSTSCVSGFGMCSSMANPAVASATAAALGVLTPQPCTPMIAAPWAPGSSSVMVGNYPALTDNSKALCAYAGLIEITMAGQMTVTAG